MKTTVALLLVAILLGAALLVLVAQGVADPLAPYRAPDGSLRIPGGALTPELQRLIFGGNNLQPYLNLSYAAPMASPYATAAFASRGYEVPNPNVFLRPGQRPETILGGIAHAFARWFPPVDWGAQLRSAAGWFFGLFTWDARAAVTVDSTTVTDVSSAASTCTTTQTAGAGDDAVLVLLSERNTTPFLSVTYGAVTLTLVSSTAANGSAAVRTEVWGFAGALPVGATVMTATLSGGLTARMTCATVLLAGAKLTGSFINGTSNNANSANANVTLLGTVAAGNLAVAVAAIQNSGGAGSPPTAVAGTGATAVDLYGVATPHCTGGGAANECAAGADLPNPGTALSWTNPSSNWVVSAVEIVAIPTCGTVGGGECYRIGTGGIWSSSANWSNSPGGASCGCVPLSTDSAVFNGTPTGTTSLSASTTVAGIDMTGFAGTLDTTASNWPLTINGDLVVQGSLMARGSAVLVTGNVTVVGAGTTVSLAASTWTVNGTWTNNSTSASWGAGTGTFTIRDAASGTLTFATLGVNEFNNLTLDASVVAGVRYTMAANSLQIGGTLAVQNSTPGATGPTILDTSAANLAITTGALLIGPLGAAQTESSAITVNGAMTVSAASGYVANTGGAWIVTGAWSDVSTSASWSFAAMMTFRSTTSRTMTFGPQPGN